MPQLQLVLPRYRGESGRQLETRLNNHNTQVKNLSAVKEHLPDAHNQVGQSLRRGLRAEPQLGGRCMLREDIEMRMWLPPLN